MARRDAIEQQANLGSGAAECNEKLAGEIKQIILDIGNRGGRGVLSSSEVSELLKKLGEKREEIEKNGAVIDSTLKAFEDILL